MDETIIHTFGNHHSGPGIDTFVLGYGSQAAFECKKGFAAYYSTVDQPRRIHIVGDTHKGIIASFVEEFPERPFIVTGMVPDGFIRKVRESSQRFTTVTAATHCTDPSAWVIHADDTSIGRQVVDHLHAAGYRHLACWGKWDIGLRGPQFTAAEERCRELGLTFHRLIPPASLAWGATDQWFSETIDGLPGPLGIFAFQDRDAAFLRETCLRCGIDVPNRVGLLGVDDDIRVCTDIAPELSSVRVPWREIGWQLALTCQGLWEGNQPSERRRRVSAYGVHRRGSTDLASRQPGDDLVRRFLTAARRAALRGKGVRDLLPRLGVSQPTLYRRVTAALGRSPSKLILDFRTDKACQLLRESDLSLAGVAQRSGFSNERSLYGAFTARYPVSPGEWRKG